MVVVLSWMYRTGCILTCCLPKFIFCAPNFPWFGPFCYLCDRAESFFSTTTPCHNFTMNDSQSNNHDEGSNNSVLSTPDRNKLSSIFLGDGGFEALMKERSRVRLVKPKKIPCFVSLPLQRSSSIHRPLITTPLASLFPFAVEEGKRRAFPCPGHDSTHRRREGPRGGNTKTYPVNSLYPKELHAQNSGDGAEF